MRPFDAHMVINVVHMILRQLPSFRVQSYRMFENTLTGRVEATDGLKFDWSYHKKSLDCCILGQYFETRAGLR